MSEKSSEGFATLGFRVTDEIDEWRDYGITERVGRFGDNPKWYKVITISDGEFAENVVKGPGFIPVPNQVASAIGHRLASELGMKVQEEVNANSNDRYYLLLRGNERAQVEVGDYVAWGLILENSPVGSFRMRTFLLRLKCTNGLVAPEEPEQVAIKKSYDVEEMTKKVLGMAERKRAHLEEKLEFFRALKRYRLNAELAQILARRFPSPIIAPSITVKREQGVPVVVDYENKDLWSVYNDITYNISHRQLKLSTRVQWTEEATAVLQKWVANAEHED